MAGACSETVSRGCFVPFSAPIGEGMRLPRAIHPKRTPRGQGPTYSSSSIWRPSLDFSILTAHSSG